MVTINQTADENCLNDTKICVPLSLFMKGFELARDNLLSGQRGKHEHLKTSVDSSSSLECTSGLKC